MSAASSLTEVVEDEQDILTTKRLAHSLRFNHIRRALVPRPTCDQLLVEHSLQVVKVRSLPQRDPQYLRKRLPDAALADKPARDDCLADTPLHASWKSHGRNRSHFKNSFAYHATEANART